MYIILYFHCHLIFSRQNYPKDVCLFILQEQLDISPGLLMTGQALELIPSQVQYVYWKVFYDPIITRDVIFTALFFSPKALVATSQGRVQAQVLLWVLQIPSQVN